MTLIAQLSNFDVSNKDPYLIKLMIQLIEESKINEDNLKEQSKGAWALYDWLLTIIKL